MILVLSSPQPNSKQCRRQHPCSVSGVSFCGQSCQLAMVPSTGPTAAHWSCSSQFRGSQHQVPLIGRSSLFSPLFQRDACAAQKVNCLLQGWEWLQAPQLSAPCSLDCFISILFSQSIWKPPCQQMQDRTLSDRMGCYCLAASLPFHAGPPTWSSCWHSRLDRPFGHYTFCNTFFSKVV